VLVHVMEADYGDAARERYVALQKPDKEHGVPQGQIVLSAEIHAHLAALPNHSNMHTSLLPARSGPGEPHVPSLVSKELHIFRTRHPRDLPPSHAWAWFSLPMLHTLG
jgi:hypothetical protein